MNQSLDNKIISLRILELIIEKVDFETNDIVVITTLYQKIYKIVEELGNPA